MRKGTKNWTWKFLFCIAFSLRSLGRLERCENSNKMEHKKPHFLAQFIISFSCVFFLFLIVEANNELFWLIMKWFPELTLRTTEIDRTMWIKNYAQKIVSVFVLHFVSGHLLCAFGNLLISLIFYLPKSSQKEIAFVASKPAVPGVSRTRRARFLPLWPERLQRLGGLSTRSGH